MATLTPSVLLTLLQSMNSDSIPLGEHRSAVHQVTDIVSAPSSTLSPEDLWQSHDFFIQLSDSVNSTYVYLSDRDAELIVSNRTQLGQLVHLHRLHFGLPVPLAIGISPISSQPHCPILGSLVPLIVIPSSSHTDDFVIQLVSPSTADSIVKPSPVLVPRENFYSASSRKSSKSTSISKRKSSKSTSISKPKQRVSSPAFRNPSPASDKQGIRGIYRSLFRFPSKCEVSSLVASNEKKVKRARQE
ncbi:hypothetical protein KSP40_PGU011974 [Platanthera guangdongensis]|uniref:DUF936 domain-containing protein n=1 Tax=Platanthera guangdongensis TaxID=2320717 RepID=A0ABR2MCA1_9ASPA